MSRTLHSEAWSVWVLCMWANSTANWMGLDRHRKVSMHCFLLLFSAVQCWWLIRRVMMSMVTDNWCGEMSMIYYNSPCCALHKAFFIISFLLSFSPAGSRCCLSPGTVVLILMRFVTFFLPLTCWISSLCAVSPDLQIQHCNAKHITPKQLLSESSYNVRNFHSYTFRENIFSSSDFSL